MQARLDCTTDAPYALTACLTSCRRWPPPARCQARADAEAACEERLRLELAQQALKYERRVQELEVAGCGGERLGLEAGLRGVLG